MTSTITRTATFTVTSARYITSKIAADLRSMNRLYGSPPLAEIDDYAEEAALLLRDGFLERVDYGLRRQTRSGDWTWVLRLRYVVTPTGGLEDANPGGMPAYADTVNAAWYSYLVKSAAFHQLIPEEQVAAEAALSHQPDRCAGDRHRRRHVGRCTVLLPRRHGRQPFGVRGSMTERG
jgi:hypothetical protein